MATFFKVYLNVLELVLVMAKISSNNTTSPDKCFPHKIIIYFLPLFIVSLILFSPFLSAIFCISILLCIGDKLDRSLTFLLSIVSISSIVFIYSSRGFYPLSDGADDVNVYFQNYNALLNSDYKAIFQYGGGVEIGLPIYMYFVGEIFGEITRNSLLLIIGLPTAIALICWFYIFPSGCIPTRYHALLLAGMTIIYSYSASNLLLRQFVSSVILLYSLSVKGRNRSYLLLILSASFHVTSIPFYLMYRIYTRSKFGNLLFLLFFFLLILSLTYLSDILSLVGLNALALKLSYYSLDGIGNQDKNLAISLNAGTLILLSLAAFYITITKVLYLASLKSIKLRFLNFNRNARAIFVMLVCTVFSMHFAWFPTRLFLIPVYFILPVIMFFSLEKRVFLLMHAFFLSLFLQRIYSWVNVGDFDTSLWIGYPMWAWKPFYYFL